MMEARRGRAVSSHHPAVQPPGVLSTILNIHFPVSADVFRPPTTPSLHSHGSRGSDVLGTCWLIDGKWSVVKLLDLTNTLRAALAEGRKLTSGELEELNTVLEMMVRRKVP